MFQSFYKSCMYKVLYDWLAFKVLLGAIHKRRSLLSGEEWIREKYDLHMYVESALYRGGWSENQKRGLRLWTVPYFFFFFFLSFFIIIYLRNVEHIRPSYQFVKFLSFLLWHIDILYRSYISCVFYSSFYFKLIIQKCVV